MKRASYRHAVWWIAMNDDYDLTGDEEEVFGIVSVALVADVFEVDQRKVARDVVRARQKEEKKK